MLDWPCGFRRSARKCSNYTCPKQPLLRLRCQAKKLMAIMRATESQRKVTFKKEETPKGAKAFPKGASGNPKGRPVGSFSLDQRRVPHLEGEDKLPEAITILSALQSAPIVKPSKL